MQGIGLRLVGALLGASLGCAGCTGTIGGGTEGQAEPREPAGTGPAFAPGGVSGSGGALDPSVPAGAAGAGAVGSCGSGLQVGAERIHRLTPEEYESSLRAFVGDDSLSPVLDADREPIATLDGVRKWFNAADDAVPAAAAWLGAYGDCDADDEACAVTLYEAFAERAFRRPLSGDERAWLSESWQAFPAAAPVSMRLETMAELILQAPQVLYLYPEGTTQDAIRVLDGHERAERLAYFLWDAPPDDPLLNAASAGELETAAGMRAQAERMLADERAKPVLRAFLADWLELDGATILPSLDDTPKDEELYPGFDEAMRQSMRAELEAFMDYVMFEQDGSLEALFGSTRAYVNGPLATVYGIENGPEGADDWQWVDLDPTRRAGMLTRAGFLAVHASQSATSPIRRGVYMLREVLCVDLPPPPANVDNSAIAVDDVEDDVTTVREATVARTGQQACAGCHVMINELGFAFEHYDAIGRWQDTEVGTGGTIDATAMLANAGVGLDGPIDGALELSARMAKSPAVVECATRRWFEVALRRSPVELDACSLQTIQAKASATQSIRELLLAMVESDAFLHVNHGE